MVALCAAGSLILSACGSSAPPPPPSSQGNIVSEPTPQHVPLINSKGQTVTLSDFRGKDIVLAPFLTLCTDECPLVTGAFIALQHDVAAAGLSHKIIFMEISVDWRRDSPARLTAYTKEFGADWPLLTATKTNMAKFWKPFGVDYQEVPEGTPAQTDWWTGKPLTFDVNHTDGFILINSAGRERFINAAPPNLKGKLGAKLSSLLDDGGRQNLTAQSDPNWTLAIALHSISWLAGKNIPSVATT
jgi:protein SCO1